MLYMVIFREHTLLQIHTGHEGVRMGGLCILGQLLYDHAYMINHMADKTIPNPDRCADWLLQGQG